MQDHPGDLFSGPAHPHVQAEAAPAVRPGAEAGGGDACLAHDFGNVAMSIVSAANLLQRFSHDPERVAQIAGLLRETGERAIAISRRLRP